MRTTKIMKILKFYFTEVPPPPASQTQPPQPEDSDTPSLPASETVETTTTTEENATEPLVETKEIEEQTGADTQEASTEDVVENETCGTPQIGTPHDESDFEDNITVTVPPPHFQSNNIYRDRHINGRHISGRHMRPPGMDTPPKNPQMLQVKKCISLKLRTLNLRSLAFLFFFSISIVTRKAHRTVTKI